MRLIDAITRHLQWFDDDKIPKYAILSHRWEDEEVLYEDMRSGNAPRMKGYVKLQNACEQARQDNCQYIWIDTCCINKDSSSELSEAINSMYAWYQNSERCYAFLSDVQLPAGESVVGDDFERSVWWERAWTLQELIAPGQIDFFEHSWRHIGTRSTLLERISKTTGIHKNALLERRPHDFSIAQRMSWASRRKSTRREDIAYSLLGIFDVNMPMLYGEGMKAFVRLQEEIIKRSDDQSIFAWEASTEQPQLLAESPWAFRNCRDIVPCPIPHHRPSPYSLTNMGLEIQIPHIIWSLNTYLALLLCHDQTTKHHVGIFLGVNAGPGQHARIFLDKASIQYIRPERFIELELRQSAQLTYGTNVPTHVRQEELLRASPHSGKLLIRQIGWHWTGSLYGFHLGACYAWPRELESSEQLTVYARRWDPRTTTMELPDGSYGTAGVVVFRHPARSRNPCVAVKLGFDVEFRPVCLIWYHFPPPKTVDYRPLETLVAEEPQSPQELDKFLDSRWVGGVAQEDGSIGVSSAEFPGVTFDGLKPESEMCYFTGTDRRLSKQRNSLLERTGLSVQFSYEMIPALRGRHGWVFKLLFDKDFRPIQN
ncbi:hypothetical protein G647_07979 [Cladophialophora carrionii CBS 160.54]|uniref:Uncharacterized protein n=1 Tax=Cladophialophora carrionii CBS 160.54 TaxID=1279043 RepID=V9D6L9_9EURO|nr:uncharacterized protein G647_07979 [Cladophialophora carrionii CBS 160.54]ETI21632.1 hypothetical protein G647_07979 [Cladophialophora carrionii CBS 160.54]